MLTKVCTECKQEKSVDEFWLRSNGYKKYPMTACKKCSSERTKRWRATPKGQLARKKYNLAKAYGITLEVWNTMLIAQGGKCGICRRDFNQLKMTPFVDHNHATGIVRGLLCPVCNQFLGLIQDDPKKLYFTILYLAEGYKESVGASNHPWEKLPMALSLTTS